MIVRPADDRLLVITQPDHAHLALRIMNHCVPLRTRPRGHAIVLAIREHDNGWTELDAAPMVDSSTGRIADFMTAPISIRQDVWPRGVERIQEPWAAALVAQHALTIYERYRAHAEWSGFFATMESMRDERVCEAGGSLDDLVGDYAFVRLGDLISLAFCTGWTDQQRFGTWAVQRFDSRVIVTPDLFGGNTIPFEVTARELSNRPFTSDADLQDALRTAQLTVLRGEVGPACLA
jgi:hypothetical protein